MKIIKQIIFTLFALVFMNAGLDKFLHYMPMPELTPEQMDLFGAMTKLVWLIPLVGVMELLGGLLVIIPKTRALGGLVILPVMVGVLLHNITLSPEGILIAAVMAAINLWIILDNVRKYRPMIA